jgi:hypothetical protein
MPNNYCRSFGRPSSLTQEVKLFGGNNSHFAECMKGVEQVREFINIARTEKGYVSLHDEMEHSIRASTPLVSEPDKVFFGAVDCEIPHKLPAYHAMRAAVAKHRARYTTENDVLFSKRTASDGYVI